MKNLLLSIAFGICGLSWGFVPPPQEVLKKAFLGRRAMPTETQFKHQIKIEGANSLLVEEKLAEIEGKTYHLFYWNSGSAGATSNASGYTFNNRKKIFGSSRIFNAYFTQVSADKFRELLISEGFSKRSQWEQYQASFAPQGNPALWDVKAGYLVHSDVFFSRTETGPSITLLGFDNGSQSKSVSFDKETFLLSEIKWQQPEGSDLWWFQGARKMEKGGVFPSRMGFVTRGNQMISSQLIQRRFLNDREKKLWLQKFQTDSQGGDFLEVEAALKVLLSHR